MIIEIFVVVAIGWLCAAMIISSFPLLWPALCCEICCFSIVGIMILLPLAVFCGCKWFGIYPAIFLLIMMGILLIVGIPGFIVLGDSPRKWLGNIVSDLQGLNST